MKISFVDLLFLLSLLLLYFLPKKSEKHKWLWIIPLSVFLINFGIRIYLINQKHVNADTISTQQTEIAKLETKATEAQRALLELQERLKPRQLTEKQMEYLVTVIKGKSPGAVWLNCKAGDEEARKFGEQIFNIMRFANWSIINNTLHDIAVYNANPSSIVGIVITINKDLKSIPLGIDLLHKTMLQFGFTSRIEKSSKDSIEIWFGAKP